MSRFAATLALTAALIVGTAGTAHAADGTWDRAWGNNVDGGNGVFGVCTVAASCTIGLGGPLGGAMGEPTGVATDSAGNVYVADRQNHRIQKFDSSGTWERAWGKGVDGGTAGTGFEVCTVAANCLAGSGGGLGGEMLFPNGVATDSAGNVYVSEDDRIQKFSSSGTWERAWGKGVDGGAAGTDFEVCTVAANCVAAANSLQLGGEMNVPYGIATGPAGQVYVAETFGDRVQKFNSVGTWERAWGRDVDGGAAGTDFEVCTVAADCKNGLDGGKGGEMIFPRGVATDPAGNVYVTEGNRVQRFDAFGTWDRAWGENVNGGGVFGICTVAVDCLTGASGDDPGGELNGPEGIGTDRAGNVYVADTFSHRIQRFNGAGAWDRAWGKRVNGPNVFEVCTVAADCLAGFGGVLGGEMNTPIGVATDPSGALYVADSINNRIQKFSGGDVVVPPDDTPTPTPTPIPNAPSSGPTGERAAALKKCKKVKKRARAACKKKANKRPV